MASWNCSCSRCSCSASDKELALTRLALSIDSPLRIHPRTWGIGTRIQINGLRSSPRAVAFSDGPFRHRACYLPPTAGERTGRVWVIKMVTFLLLPGTSCPKVLPLRTNLIPSFIYSFPTLIILLSQCPHPLNLNINLSNCIVCTFLKFLLQHRIVQINIFPLLVPFSFFLFFKAHFKY